MKRRTVKKRTTRRAKPKAPVKQKVRAKTKVREKPRAKLAAVARANPSRTHRADGPQAESSRREPRVRLELVAELPPRPAPEPDSAKAPSDGSAKQRMLFELVRSRAAVKAALRGLEAEAAERPMGEGKWSVREIVLHLCLRDRARIRELESTLRGETHSWANVSREEQDRQNAEDLAPLEQVEWEEALRLLGSTRHALREALESVPAEPSEVWTPDHPFGRMLLGLPPHDVHHAEVITLWRSEQGV